MNKGMVCQSGRVSFGISFTTPAEFPVVLRFVRTITFNAFGPLDSTQESGVAPFPAILALGDSRIHICSFNHSNVIAHVETSVDK